jgi:hypothetical protein
MKEQKRYIERGDLKGANNLEVSVYYYKGGTSCFTGQTSPRGYYLSVRPVTLERGMVSFSLFSGCKRLILETGRYSYKQFSKAVAIAKDYESELIAAVVAESKAA